MFPTGSLWREMPISRAFLYTSSKVPSQSAPRERCSFSKALLQLSLRVPSECTPLIIRLSLEVPGKWAPLHVSQQGPYGERCSIPRANGLFFHLYLSETPIKEPSHKNWENTFTVRGAPCRRKAYIQWGAAWFPKGIGSDTAITTQCHAAFSTIPSSLVWVDQSPISQHGCS